MNLDNFHENFVTPILGTVGTAVALSFNDFLGAATGVVSLCYVTIRVYYLIRDHKTDNKTTDSK